MSSKIETAFVPSLTRPTPRSLLARVVGWLVVRNAAYREAQKLARMPAERLRDMGMTSLERADSRPADQLPASVTTRW